MAGRKPKITPEMQEALIKALVAGNYIETACHYAGISTTTYYRWIQEAQEPNAKKALRDLSDAVTKAKAEAEYRNVQAIQVAANNGTWQAAAWFLERGRKDNWGRQQKVELTGANGTPISVELDAKTALLNMLREKSESLSPKE